jgi:hypothetical protein
MEKIEQPIDLLIYPPSDDFPVFLLCNLKKIRHPCRPDMVDRGEFASYFPKPFQDKLITYVRQELSG